MVDSSLLNSEVIGFLLSNLEVVISSVSNLEIVDIPIFVMWISDSWISTFEVVAFFSSIIEVSDSSE